MTTMAKSIRDPGKLKTRASRLLIDQIEICPQFANQTSGRGLCGCIPADNFRIPTARVRVNPDCNAANGMAFGGQSVADHRRQGLSCFSFLWHYRSRCRSSVRLTIKLRAHEVKRSQLS